MISILHIYLLGDFLLLSDEAPVTSVDLPRLQSLLAYLLLHHNAPQARTHLAYLLWPDSTDAQAHTNLRNLVHKLRQALPHVGAYLQAGRQTLSWQPDARQAAWTLDVQDFEEALAQADKARNGDEARHALEAAVKFYRGDLLPSCYDEWILPERDRLRQSYLTALVRLAALQEQQRDYDAAIATAQRLLRYDPLHEATYHHLMHLYAVNGDRAAALRTYHTCATTLERELGAKPGKAMREVYERLFLAEVPLAEGKPPSAPLVSVVPLVGRQREWAELQAAWHASTAGGPHLVLLSGEAGIGKTRLAEELLTWAERQGIATASARCYAPERSVAYTPVVAWLRSEALRKGLASLHGTWLTEVARLLPDILVDYPQLPRPGPLSEGWQRQHLFEALARAVLLAGRSQVPSSSARQPLLLMLDDIQWCDGETLAWVQYLLRFDRQAPLLLLGTMRSEEVSTAHGLMTALLSLRRARMVTELALNPLTAAETTDLAGHLLGHQGAAEIGTGLFRETEGNPLFIVESVRARAIDATHPTDGASSEEDARLPPTVQAVIAARLAQLSATARELVSVAAVIGRDFTVEVLARASGLDEDTLVQGLDELWRRRIVREQGGEAYDFSHDKLREGAYSALSALRRRRLHRRVAETLEMGYGGAPDAVVGQIAGHYERAALLPKAIEYYRRAGEVAQQVYANQEAQTSFQQALLLMEALPAGQAPQAWENETAASLHERIGDIFALTGQANRARECYQGALSRVPGHQFVWQARLYRKIGKTHLSPMNIEEAVAACNSAETALSNSPDEQVEEMWQEWLQVQFDRIWLYHVHAQFREMADLVEKVRPVAETYGTPAQMVTFYASIARRNLTRDRYLILDETLLYAGTALKASQKSGNDAMIAQAQFAYAFYKTWHDDFKEGEVLFRAALQTAERIGDALLQAQCLTYLSIALRRLGLVDETHRVSLQARVVGTEAQRPEYIGTALSNLGWVAYRLDTLDECHEKCLAALELWRPLSIQYPFCWVALFPLMTVALTRKQVIEAIDYARMLLEPNQQRLPGPLTEVLVAALQAWDAEQPETVRIHLQQAIILAGESSYL